MEILYYLIPVGLYLLYKWATANYDYFEKQGIDYLKPYPFVGSSFSDFFKRQPLFKSFSDKYNKYKSKKVYGFFQLRRPGIAIVDPKLLKMITVKDFDHFVDHQGFLNEDVDPLLGNMLSVMKGNKWRDMRATLSPAFTGSKMRQMFEFVSTVGQQTALTMKQDIQKGGNNEFEFKALAMKFTVDVIASCAFGIEVNSFATPDNEFYKIAEKVTNTNMFLQIMKFLGFLTVPKLMKLFNIRLMDSYITEFFQKATIETMKVREEKGIVRPDMINLLMEAKKGQLASNNNIEEKINEGFATAKESELDKLDVKRVWDDNTLAAQCLIFFFAGFDTVSTTMSFMAYELALNPEVQQKLFEEISEMNRELGGKKITYEKLQGMKYMDQTVTETLRKWPIAAATDRVCTKEYDLIFDGKKIHLEKDCLVIIPIHCFHHDPEYYPEPEKFDPERFSPENRNQINLDAFMPFGVGPRNCIGSRFALMELKTIFFYMMLNFSIEVCSKTTIPFEYEKVPFGTRPINGTWLALKPRQSE